MLYSNMLLNHSFRQIQPMLNCSSLYYVLSLCDSRFVSLSMDNSVSLPINTLLIHCSGIEGILICLIKHYIDLLMRGFNFDNIHKALLDIVFFS